MTYLTAMKSTVVIYLQRIYFVMRIDHLELLLDPILSVRPKITSIPSRKLRSFLEGVKRKVV